MTATLINIASQEPVLLANLGPHAPDELCRVVKRDMRKEQGERFQTTAEMAEALEAAMRALELGGVDFPEGVFFVDLSPLSVPWIDSLAHRTGT